MKLVKDSELARVSQTTLKGQGRKCSSESEDNCAEQELNGLEE